ncbi:hypothetical protein IV203_013483 [Nitzschia inconspicua]|uniref:Uncharacterized protein n=1 Tax=Nitzschia inconspicua TaxID=303405 RepID=A0A9K3M6B1_9STRA|nr:hypothetical protein IV203_013483 [Nitzschia inconspicua]
MAVVWKGLFGSSRFGNPPQIGRALTPSPAEEVDILEMIANRRSRRCRHKCFDKLLEPIDSRKPEMSKFIAVVKTRSL